MDDEIMINGVKYHRVVEAEPIRVGDWVEAINDGTPGLVKPGAKGIVQKPSNVGFWVKWKSGEFESCFDNEWSIKIANLRKIDPPAPAPERKFKVGDWVRVVKSECGGHPVGAVGIIAEIAPGYDVPTYAVRVSGSKYDYVHSYDELEPASAPARLKYKPGDIVLVPVRVVEVDEDTSKGWQPYRVKTVSGDERETLWWLSRAALEPPAPQVGQRVIAWDQFVGQLMEKQNEEYPYSVNKSTYNFTCAVAIE